VIDLSTETAIPLAAAAKLIPPGRGGRRTHLSTLVRWILRGSRGPEGARVKLEAMRVGNRWITSREALQRFAEALTPRHAAQESLAPRSPAKRRGASERAARQLDELGI
jgi:hypothetical protein